jgi:hypothetical protein
MLPKHYDGHTWADYVELLCLTDADGEITLAEVEKRVTKRKDVGEDYSEPDKNDDGKPDHAVDEVPAVEDEDDNGESGSDEALQEDYRNTRVADIFQILSHRADSLGDAYPFVLSPDSALLSRSDNLNEKQRLYLFLLLCSNLRYVPKNRRWQLPRGFELVSARAMRRLVPPDAEVHLFGKGEPGERYTGTLWNKISTLAADLCDDVIARRRDFKDNNTGDGGLDIVAWVTHHDELPSRLVMFGQCACTEEWVTKQRSSGPEVWSTLVRLLALPANLVFIPHMFRDAQGLWHREADIHHSVLVDRFRILRILDAGADLAVPDIATPHVEELWAVVDEN